jgi:hypothetical protein
VAGREERRRDEAGGLERREGRGKEGEYAYELMILTSECTGSGGEETGKAGAPSR